MATVLIVDDDPAIVGIIRSHLSATGHTILTASNGREALEANRANDVDLIITDIYMPEMDGIELISSLRHSGYDGAILALSGGGTLDTSEGRGPARALTPALLLGAGRTLAKPFTKREFLDTVEALIGDGSQAGSSIDPNDRAQPRSPRPKID